MANKVGRKQTPIGKLYQEAREAKGLSIDELAKIAHINRQVIWAIENELEPKVSIQDDYAIRNQLDLGGPYFFDKGATQKIRSLEFKCKIMSKALGIE